MEIVEDWIYITNAVVVIGVSIIIIIIPLIHQSSDNMRLLVKCMWTDQGCQRHRHRDIIAHHEEKCSFRVALPGTGELVSGWDLY